MPYGYAEDDKPCSQFVEGNGTIWLSIISENRLDLLVPLRTSLWWKVQAGLRFEDLRNALPDRGLHIGDRLDQHLVLSWLPFDRSPDAAIRHLLRLLQVHVIARVDSLAVGSSDAWSIAYKATVDGSFGEGANLVRAKLAQSKQAENIECCKKLKILKRR